MIITLNELRLKINSILDEDIETSFKEISVDNDYTRRIFSTTKGNKYVIDFIKKELDKGGNDIIINGDPLPIINFINTDIYPKLDCVDIGFTTFENMDTDDDVVYGSNSNRNESSEVMGRLANIIKKYTNTHKNIKIYIVGEPTNLMDKTNEERKYNDDEIRVHMYKKVFRDSFSSEYKLFNGISDEYPKGGGTMFFINKSILLK